MSSKTKLAEATLAFVIFLVIDFAFGAVSRLCDTS